MENDNSLTPSSSRGFSKTSRYEKLRTSNSKRKHPNNSVYMTNESKDLLINVWILIFFLENYHFLIH